LCTGQSAHGGCAPGAALITLQDADFLDRLAAGKARAAGYTNVYSVTGGMSLAGGWIDAGLALVAAGSK
jgi:hypothetical protein